MSWSVSEELKRSYDLATLRREADALKTTRHWNNYQAMLEGFEQQRDKERTSYRKEYQTRVEAAQRRILKEKAAPNRKLMHPHAQHDWFSPEDTLRQAQREVREAHNDRMAAIDDAERSATRSYLKQAMRENSITGEARQAFKRATNRRSGKDRRGGPKRQGPTR